jgi:hypothetical protein
MYKHVLCACRVILPGRIARASQTKLSLPPLQDFESCVRSNDPECRYLPAQKRDGFGDHRRQTMFFCGHSDDCT